MLSAAMKFVNPSLCEFYFSTALHTVVEVCLEYCVSLERLFFAPMKIILKLIFNGTLISHCGQVRVHEKVCGRKSCVTLGDGV